MIDDNYTEKKQTEIVQKCQTFFGFKLPSVSLNMISHKFIKQYNFFDNDVCKFLRVKKLSIFLFFLLFHCIFIVYLCGE